MSFGSDIARGAGGRLIVMLLVVFISGGAIAMGLYFGISWLIDHISIVIK